MRTGGRRMSLRRRPRAMACSLYCTDVEWERIRMLARRRGLSISRHMVECGLTVDPEAEPAAPPRLVLHEAEQRVLFDRVTAIAERTVPAGTEDAVMARVRNSLSFPVESKMRTMMGEGREGELRAILTELFGEDAAAATLNGATAHALSPESSDIR